MPVPWGNNTMAVHQDGSVVACAVDYEGKFKAGNLNDITVKGAWAITWKRSSGSRIASTAGATFPRLCKGCGDWQVAGAEYEEEKSRRHAAVLVLRQQKVVEPA